MFHHCMRFHCISYVVPVTMTKLTWSAAANRADFQGLFRVPFGRPVNRKPSLIRLPPGPAISQRGNRGDFWVLIWSHEPYIRTCYTSSSGLPFLMDLVDAAKEKKKKTDTQIMAGVQISIFCFFFLLSCCIFVTVTVTPK